MRKIMVVLCLLPLVAWSQQTRHRLVTYTDYLLYVPVKHQPSQKLPLILSLHGSGERGDDLGKVALTGLPSLLNNNDSFPFIVLSPLCPAGREWDSQALLNLLDHIEDSLPVDKDRIYVTGYSLGGFATWYLAQAAPERFAAIIPICGGGNPERLCIMRDMSVWAFHGEKDDAVPLDESERMVKQLRKFESDVKFTVYPGTGHGIWMKTYNDTAIYSWLLSKSLAKPSPVIPAATLKQYTGNYRYSANEQMEISTAQGILYVRSSVGGSKLELVPQTATKFRIKGPLTGDGAVYFNVENGKVKGLTIGPCDHTFCARMKEGFVR